MSIKQGDIYLRVIVDCSDPTHPAFTVTDDIGHVLGDIEDVTYHRSVYNGEYAEIRIRTACVHVISAHTLPPAGVVDVDASPSGVMLTERRSTPMLSDMVARIADTRYIPDILYRDDDSRSSKE